MAQRHPQRGLLRFALPRRMLIALWRRLRLPLRVAPRTCGGHGHRCGANVDASPDDQSPLSTHGCASHARPPDPKQQCCDVTLASPSTRERRPQPSAASRDGAARSPSLNCASVQYTVSCCGLHLLLRLSRRRTLMVPCLAPSSRPSHPKPPRPVARVRGPGRAVQTDVEKVFKKKVGKCENQAQAT